MAHKGRPFRFHLRRDLLNRNFGLDFVSLPNRIKCYLFHHVNPPLPGTTYGTFVADVGVWDEATRTMRFTCTTPGWNPAFVLSVAAKMDTSHQVGLYWWIQIHDAGTLKYEVFVNQINAWEQSYLHVLAGWIRYPTPFPFPYDVYGEIFALPYDEE